MWFDSPDSNSVFRQAHEHRRRDFCFSSFGRLLCVFLISGRKSTNGYAGDCLRDCHTKLFWILFLISWQSRVSQGIPSSNVLDAAVRKTRKAVQEEKHVPFPTLHRSWGKPQTVNSGESISPIFPEIRDTIKILPMFPSLAAQPGNLSAKRKFQ